MFTSVEERDEALQAAASAEDAMADGLIGLAGKGLTTSEVADLCEMTQGEVSKLMKRRRDAGGGSGLSSDAKGVRSNERQEQGRASATAGSSPTGRQAESDESAGSRPAPPGR